MSDSSDLRGVRGWLLWMIFAFCILGPMLGSIQLVRSFQDHLAVEPELALNATWRLYRKMAYGILFFSTGLRWASGWLLLRVFRPISVKFAVVALWATSVGSTGLNFLIAYLMFKGISSRHALMVQMIQGALMAGVWTAYLFRSVRVQNTYGR